MAKTASAKGASIWIFITEGAFPPTATAFATRASFTAATTAAAAYRYADGRWLYDGAWEDHSPTGWRSSGRRRRRVARCVRREDADTLDVEGGRGGAGGLGAGRGDDDGGRPPAEAPGSWEGGRGWRTTESGRWGRGWWSRRAR